jgi:hypothetical protein
MNLRLARKNREANPQSWDDLYGSIVSSEFRKKYSVDKCEAIINNYLDNPTNDEYVVEFREMQEYRKYCKSLAKSKMGM